VYRYLRRHEGKEIKAKDRNTARQTTYAKLDGSVLAREGLAAANVEASILVLRAPSQLTYNNNRAAFTYSTNRSVSSTSGSGTSALLLGDLGSREMTVLVLQDIDIVVVAFAVLADGRDLVRGGGPLALAFALLGGVVDGERHGYDDVDDFMQKKEGSDKMVARRKYVEARKQSQHLHSPRHDHRQRQDFDETNTLEHCCSASTLPSFDDIPSIMPSKKRNGSPADSPAVKNSKAMNKDKTIESFNAEVHAIISGL